MRGAENGNSQLEFGFCAEDVVADNHPIRGIKQFVDKVLKSMRPELNKMYTDFGRPSVAPETLLKSYLLIVLFSIRSERQFCEMLRYNLLFQWFLNKGLMSPAFDASVFSKNRERLLEHEMGRKFFEAVNSYLKEAKLMNSEHFTVDGTLIESWASMKSLKERNPDDRDKRIKGKKPSDIRRNDIYVSSSDPEAYIASKSKSKPMLAYMGNVLMENRYGLCVDVDVLPATGTAEPMAAMTMVNRQLRRLNIKTLGADANYYRAKFIRELQKRKIIPHVAPQSLRSIDGIDGRTFISKGYKASQIARKKVEKIFGWLKSIAHWKRSKYKGTKKVSFFALFGAAALNIMRAIKLRPELAT